MKIFAKIDYGTVVERLHY